MEVAGARPQPKQAVEPTPLGASGWASRNILPGAATTPALARRPCASPTNRDMDAVQVVMLRCMRDEGVSPRRPCHQTAPRVVPLARPPRPLARRPITRPSAPRRRSTPAQFIQTQPIFDYERFTVWLEALDKRNLLDKVTTFCGLIRSRAPTPLHFMADDVPGVVVPRACSTVRMPPATTKRRAWGGGRRHRPGDHREVTRRPALLPRTSWRYTGRIVLRLARGDRAVLNSKFGSSRPHTKPPRNKERHLRLVTLCSFRGKIVNYWNLPVLQRGATQRGG